jgi:hypothetical protein
MKHWKDIDITFDFRNDTPPGKDPDSHSRTLRRYHQLIWSKPLPSGHCFDLSDTTSKVYLHHKSEVGEFFLSSDAVIPTFTRESKIFHVTEQIPKGELDWFNSIGYTIGGMMLFPGQRVGRKMTINGARGFHPKIKDRFDLTVECILRHYLGEWSPLHETLDRYVEFFKLFKDFSGFVEFFLLQDIVDKESSAVNFFMPFDGFQTSPLPSSKEQYLSYMHDAINFIEARNKRILEHWKAQCTS